jgi:hypothetical protein
MIELGADCQQKNLEYIFLERINKRFKIYKKDFLSKNHFNVISKQHFKSNFR